MKYLNTMWGSFRGGQTMWWLLMILTAEGYAADTVYNSLDRCLAAKNSEDVCVRVTVSFAEPQIHPTQ